MPEDVQPPPVPGSSPSDLLAAVRGLSAWFWGLALIVLVLAGVLTVRLPFLARLPGHSVGLLILLVGVYHVHQAWPTHAPCRRWVRLLGLAVTLQLYLVPFLGWWRSGTAAWYALAHLILLLASGLIMLAGLARWVEAMAGHLGETELRIEARLSGWVIPALGGLSSALYAVRGGRLAWYTDPAFALHHLLVETDPFLLFPALLPFIPALAIAWTAKTRLLHTLARISGSRPV